MPETPNTHFPAEIPTAISMLGEVKAADVNHPEVAEIANFQGDWIGLQYSRMSHPDFREKFQRFIDVHTPSLKAGEPKTMQDKATSFQSHYYNQAEHYDSNLEHVYAEVVRGNSAEVGGASSRDLGHGNIGQQPTVYSDAITGSGVPLTDRQENIIAAHEAYHGMVDARGSAHEEVKSGFDWEVYDEMIDNHELNRPSYLRNPDELMARMSQFKNYFGMNGAQEFTPEHLDYLRGHYVEDTGLDNGITTLLGIVTPKTEPRFIELMNGLPV